MEEHSRDKHEAHKDLPAYVKMPIPLIDKVTLGPIKKYVKYNRFPWKMLTHIILVMVLTAQTVIVTDSDNNFARAELNVFYKLFLDDSLSLNAVSFEK